MRERHLPKDMRRELREFFEQARHVREVNDDSTLLDSMSPLLQGTVSYQANRQWLAKIWWLDSLDTSRESREFIASLAKALQVSAYVASERAPLGMLYVLRKGMCVKNWRFIRVGRVWGDDMIIDDRLLMDHSQAVALTYIELFALSAETMEASCERFPAAGMAIRKAALRIRIQRALLLYFCNMGGRQPRSFVPQAAASGYFWVGPQLSTDDKIDALHGALQPTAQTTEARLNQLTTSVDSLASTVAGLGAMLQMRFGGEVKEKLRGVEARRPRQPLDEDDEPAPLSSV